MKHKYLLLVLLSIFSYTQPAQAGFIIADTSARNLIKGVNFTGCDISISGIADNNRNLIIVISGPKQSYNIWRKQRTAGVWSNHTPHKFINLPSYLFVATSPDLKGKLSAKLLSSLQLSNSTSFTPPIQDNNSEFYHALINIKQKTGLYQNSSFFIEQLGEQLFRLKAYLPSNTTVGEYNIHIYKTDGNLVYDTLNLKFNITNIGFDQAIIQFSNDSPTKYGILSVFVSITIGLLVGFLFRKDK